MAHMLPSQFKKRKQINVGIAVKVEALDLLQSGCSLRSIAKKYGVGTSTVSDWKRAENKIRKKASIYNVDGITSRLPVILPRPTFSDDTREPIINIGSCTLDASFSSGIPTHLFRTQFNKGKQLS